MLATVSTKVKSSKSRGIQKPANYLRSFEINKADVECFYCHKKSHLIQNYYKRKSAGKHKKETTRNNAVALITSNINPCKETKDIWYADSGASKHTSFRREWFTEFHSTEGELVTMGDEATCEVKGYGTISTKRFDGRK